MECIIMWQETLFTPTEEKTDYWVCSGAGWLFSFVRISDSLLAMFTNCRNVFLRIDVWGKHCPYVRTFPTLASHSFRRHLQILLKVYFSLLCLLPSTLTHVRALSVTPKISAGLRPMARTYVSATRTNDSVYLRRRCDTGCELLASRLL